MRLVVEVTAEEVIVVTPEDPPQVQVTVNPWPV